MTILEKIAFKLQQPLWAEFQISASLGSSLLSNEKPILILSFPRSGSSWVGAMLSECEKALYLREPFTQAFMRANQDKVASFTEIGFLNSQEVYDQVAGKAFKGIPNFPGYVVHHPQRWKLHRIRNKRIVIKEVNPIALSYYLKNHSLFIIYILRHPAAVANSFYQKGWIQDQFRDRFTESALRKLSFDIFAYDNDFWYQMGLLQGYIHKKNLELLGSSQDALVLKYEDLCVDPLHQFRSVVEKAGLDWNNKLEGVIAQNSTSEEEVKPGEYGVSRKSNLQADKWREQVSSEQLMRVREGYEFFHLSYYKEDADW